MKTVAVFLPPQKDISSPSTYCWVGIAGGSNNAMLVGGGLCFAIVLKRDPKKPREKAEKGGEVERRRLIWIVIYLAPDDMKYPFRSVKNWITSLIPHRSGGESLIHFGAQLTIRHEFSLLWSISTTQSHFIMEPYSTLFMKRISRHAEEWLGMVPVLSATDPNQQN